MSEERVRRVGRLLPLGALPPPISDEEREQWETLCSISTDVGLCPQPAIDPNQPVKLCQTHTSVILAQIMNRFRGMLAGAVEISTGTQPGEFGGKE